MYLGEKFFLSYVSPEPDFKVGPFKVGPISELETVFRDAEREVWRGFGISNPQILKVDFDKTLSEYLK